MAGTDSREEDSTLSLKLLVVLSKAYKVMMSHAVGDMKKYGLSTTEFAILELLYHKGRFPLQQIGDKILMTSGSITYNIDKLENKGFLTRIPCPDDRRVIYAEISAKGVELFDRIFPCHAEAIQRAMCGLDVEEKAVAVELIKKLGLAAQAKLE